MIPSSEPERAARTVDFRNAAAVIDLFERGAQALRDSRVRDRSLVRLPRRGRLLATGDLHDNPIHLQKVIRLARLDRSADHHVILHEMIHSDRLVNGMDFSHRMLARAAELALTFPGQAHPLLANHELSQLTGKGISKGAGNSVELFNEGLAFAFGDDWEDVLDAIRQFISAMALALVTESGILCAHSLPPPHMMDKFDHDVLKRDLQPGDYVAPRGAAHLMVWGRNHTNEQIEELAHRWGVTLFCIGHEQAETGVEVMGSRLIVLNSDHERGVALPIDLGAEPPTVEQALMSAIPLSAVG